MACLSCQHEALPDHRGLPEPHEDPHPCHTCPPGVCPAYIYDANNGESAQTFQGQGGSYGGGGASGSW